MGWRPGRLLHNTAHAGGWNLARILLQALSLVLMARVLGADGYGSLAGTVALYITFGQFTGFGSGIALVRHVARNGELSARFLSTQHAYLATGLIIFALVWPPSIWLFGDELSVSTLACLAVAEVIAAPALQPLVYRYLAEERMFISGALQTIAPSARFVAIGSMAILGLEDVANFAWLYLACIATASSLVIYTTWQRNYKLTKRSSWISTARAGVPYMISSVAMTAGTELDKTIMLRFSGGIIAGQYAAAYRIMQAATLPVNSLILAAAPRMFRTVGQFRSLTKTLFLATICYALLTAFALAALAPFAYILLGDEFIDAQKYLRGLSFVVITNCVRQLVTAHLTTADAQKKRNVIEVIGLFLSITLLLVLIPLYGASGAIIALAASDLAVILLGLIYVSRSTGPTASNK